MTTSALAELEDLIRVKNLLDLCNEDVCQHESTYTEKLTALLNSLAMIRNERDNLQARLSSRFGSNR